MHRPLEERLLEQHLAVKGRRLVGHAAKFGVPAKLGDFTETISPGAFRRSLDERGDVLALIDHDASRLLGRLASGTLRLREDDIGLAFEIDLPDTSDGRDVLALAERGDIGGMSFGFRVRPGGESWNRERTQRTLHDLELVEISVATAFAAYPQTTVQARTPAAFEEHTPEFMRRRLRLIELEGGAS